jgi:hypothetical protein
LPFAVNTRRLIPLRNPIAVALLLSLHSFRTFLSQTVRAIFYWGLFCVGDTTHDGRARLQQTPAGLQIVISATGSWRIIFLQPLMAALVMISASVTPSGLIRVP